jgi:hypothetical protein
VSKAIKSKQQIPEEDRVVVELSSKYTTAVYFTFCLFLEIWFIKIAATKEYELCFGISDISIRDISNNALRFSLFILYLRAFKI